MLGDGSWYAANVDDKNGDAKITFEENGAPQTGDTAHPGVYMIILLASAAVAVYAVSRRRAR